MQNLEVDNGIKISEKKSVDENLLLNLTLAICLTIGVIIGTAYVYYLHSNEEVKNVIFCLLKVC